MLQKLSNCNNLFVLAAKLQLFVKIEKEKITFCSCFKAKLSIYKTNHIILLQIVSAHANIFHSL